MSDSVPVGWSLSRLSDLANIRSSNVDKKSSSDEIPVRLCNYTDVYYNNQITSKIKFMEATAKQNQIDRFSIQAGDVIITKDSETPDDIAIPAYVAESFTNVLCGYHLSLIRPEKDKASGSFLSHLFGLASVRHHFYILANGITRYGLNIDAIENAPILAPPLAEQHKIAAILTSVDDVIESTQAQINKLKDLKTGMMQELLTKGIGHTEFKDSPVGRIPKAWEVLNLGQVTIAKGMQTGPFGSQLHSHEYVENGIPVVMPKDMKDQKIVSKTIAKITQEKADELGRHKLIKGDILFSRRGDIGRCVLVKLENEGWICGTGCLKARLGDRILPEYFIYYLTLTNVVEWLINNSVGQTMLNLNTSILSELPVPVPSLEEQRLIASSMDALINSIDTKERKLEQLNSIKKAIMQDLLTGKVRVKVN